MKRSIPYVVIAGVLGAAVLMFWYLKRPAAPERQDIPAERSAPAARSVGRGAEPAHTLGDPEALVMIEEFGDFECPPCASLHPVLKMMKREFGSELVIVFREFPIEATHTHAMKAAHAAEAAAIQGKFWEMHDLLYANQNEWKNAADVDARFENYAHTIELTMDQFKNDISSDLVGRRIALDRERGYSIGVNSTPTIFLNGREVPLDSLSADRLRVLIKSQLPEHR